MAKIDKKNETAPSTVVAPPIDPDLQEWHGAFGGNVDGWWAPEKASVLYGVLVNFISKERSEKLQSNTLVFRLLAEAEFVKNGGSDKIEGAKGDDKLYTAPIGAMIGVPEWKQLEGLWPRKAGFKVRIEHSGEKRSIGKGRSMYDIKIAVSKEAVEKVEIYEETDAPSNSIGEGAEQFTVPPS